MIVMFTIANLALVYILAILSHQPGITTQFIVLFAAAMLLLVNGAMWLGLRPGTAKLMRRPEWYFGVAGLAFLDAALDVTGQKYSLAFTPGSVGIILIILGLRARRSNAKKDEARPDQGRPV